MADELSLTVHVSQPSRVNKEELVELLEPVRMRLQHALLGTQYKNESKQNSKIHSALVAGNGQF
eukprot:2271628-Amphidinium_carterae.5